MPIYILMEEKQIVGVIDYSDTCSLTNLCQKKGKCLSKEYWGNVYIQMAMLYIDSGDYRLRKPGILYMEVM
ncbi:MAG: hypothetical protein EZS28_048550 [Streblomastix strix]|uniref:Uncharacterized protein n=1 Tax=Streblomastix strix TaxID=222440 RepID=A0A5J4TDT3_9EUKA|nr:MAG: hypothetical protein EZS28_048550 [Streblomastix strix]